MQILKGSIFYAFYLKLLVFYRSSLLSKIVLGIVQAFRHSVIGKCIKAVAERESSVDYSVFVYVIKKLFKKMDNAAMRFSSAFSRWRGSSLLFTAGSGITRIAKEKPLPMIFPVFGFGYIIGRIVQNSLMIRDIILLGLSFIAAALFAVDMKKIKLFVKNSMVYKLYILVLG